MAKAQGFQNIMDSYFWYLPFASVSQCKYVMDRAKIPEDEWRTKREDLADEHKMTGARRQQTGDYLDYLGKKVFT